MHQLSPVSFRLANVPGRKASLTLTPKQSLQLDTPLHTNPDNNRLMTLARIRRRSMTLKQIKLDRYIDGNDNPPQESKPEIILLRSIIKRKESEIVHSSQSQRKSRIHSQDYDYYDSVVRDLISEIKLSKRPMFKEFSRSKPRLTPPTSGRKTSVTKKVPVEEREKVDIIAFTSTSSTTVKPSTQPSKSFDLRTDSLYAKKILTLLQFLFRLCYSNSMFTNLSLSNPKKTYKVKVGPGNNCLLVKSLLKRRFWLQFTNSVKGAQFVWTQDTQSLVHGRQVSCEILTLNYVLPKFKLLKRQRVKSNRPNEELGKIMSRQDSVTVDDAFRQIGNFPISEVREVSNHIPRNSIIGSKKLLFMLMSWYTEHVLGMSTFSFIPKSYHIESGNVEAIKSFLQAEGHFLDKVWIVKPGENTNRGQGITVSPLSEVKRITQSKQVHRNGELKTYIVQEYLRPFLYHGRKFDIRHYLLVTSVNGIIKGYWFKEGYIRTSSQKYDLEDLENDLVHLTNDAIQKHGENYGKFEPANKLSYANFQRYLDTNYPQKKYNFQGQIVAEMKQITTHIMRAAFCHLDPQRLGHNFELFGMDFLIDHKFKPYLIEVNANPCLEVSCPILERIIPIALEHAFRIALDPLMPPPEHFPISQRCHLSERTLDRLHYELIFDEKYEGKALREVYTKSPVKFPLDITTEVSPEEEIFDDDGEELTDGIALE